MFKFFKLRNLLTILITVAPFLIIIFLVVVIIALFKNKVRIKWRTFKGKGFRPVRGNFGLYVYCGKQGKGKTYSYVEYLLDNVKNIIHFGNVSGIRGIDYFTFNGFTELIYLKHILDYVYDIEEQLFSYILSLFKDQARAEHLFNLILEYKHSKKQLVIGYDEIFTELLKGSKLSKEVMDFLCQMRKRKIIFLTTCQEWAELPLSFRRFCRYEIDCDMKPFLWTGILIKRFKDAENMKWDNEEQEHIAPLIETTITKTRLSIANSYNTFLRISSVSAPDPSTTGSGAAD